MQLTEELKEKSKSVTETKEPAREASMELSDDDLANVSGGVSIQHIKQTLDM